MPGSDRRRCLPWTRISRALAVRAARRLAPAAATARSIARSTAAVAVAAGFAACAASPETATPDVTSQATPEPVVVRAAVDRAVATTGDLLTYSIEVDHRSELEIDLPEVGAEIAGFRIVDTGTEGPREHDGRVVFERWYRLRADLVGSYVLPPVTVGYRPAASGEGPRGAVETSALFVEVESVLPADGEATDIRDLKPLRRSPTPWPWRAVAAVAVAAALVAGFLWWRRRPRPAAPAPPPHETALARLEALRSFDAADPEAVRRFHFAVSETIRAYVEGRFGLNATDLTREELHAFLPSLGALEAVERARLERFLEATDRVKFAEHRPTEGEIERVWEDALAFVESTRPRPEPANETDPGEGTGEGAPGAGERAA